MNEVPDLKHEFRNDVSIDDSGNVLDFENIDDLINDRQANQVHTKTLVDKDQSNLLNKS